MLRRTILGAVAMLLCGVILAMSLAAQDITLPPAEDKAKAPEKSKAAEKKAAAAKKDDGKKEAKWAPAVDPKPLSENVKKGLDWLVEHQLKSGAWGQGEESSQMGSGGQLKDQPSVADTCIAALSLVRSGSTPSNGKYSNSLLEAIGYVCGEIEESDKDSLFVTATRGTRVQSKLGPYIDTFMASMLLSEVQNGMPNKKGQKRVSDALDKVLYKMKKNQRADGTWDKRGWAATLAQGMAVKGMNRAAQGGKFVSPQMLKQAQSNARSNFDAKSGKFSIEGSAGVELYAASSNLSGMADSANTNAEKEVQAREELKSAKTPADRLEAATKVKQFELARNDLETAQRAVVARMDDKAFVAGFGSNGGEEFLSHMSIGESLVVTGGDNWKAWDKSMTENMNRVQNKDGSWSGHHCITGRTFCTSAALLVLMVDRSPVPVAAKMKRK